MNSRLLLMLALVLCAVLRFYRLDGYGLWSDEFVTLLIVSGKSFKEIVQTCFEVPQPMPPLYFLANKWIYDLFAPGEIGLRALSAAASVLAGYFLFAVGRSLISPEVGLWSLLLFAVNSTQIVYAQNARPYALGLMLSGASTLCLLNWKRRRSRFWAFAYVTSTALLLHSHYIFSPLLLIHCLYLVISRRWASHDPEKASQWRQWLSLQGVVAVLLLPLYPQLWRIVQARHSLNWERRYPAPTDFLMFLDLPMLSCGVAAWVALAVAAKVTQSSFRSDQTRAIHSKDGGESRRSTTEHESGGRIPLLGGESAVRRGGGLWFGKRYPPRRCAPPLRGRGFSENRDNWLLLGLWYLVPVGLFFGLALGNGLNLFVERYLILASLPIFLALPALAFAAGPKWVARGALLLYLLAYLYTTPGAYFQQKGQFSQGVPGGNEWREALAQLAETKFQSSLLLFQSPFIESNQLDFADKPHLAHYLSAPLSSFYVQRPVEPFVLLPVHWWIENRAHQDFKSKLHSRLQHEPDFTLLATQEFFDYFEPWLKTTSVDGEWRTLESFRSSGALRVKRLGWNPKPPPAS